MPVVNTLVFDFDGTLVDSTAAVVASIESAMKAVAGRCPASESLESMSALTVPEIFRRLGITDPQVHEKACRVYQETYRLEGPRRAVPFEGVRKTLAHLKNAGYRMAVATNEVRENLTPMMARMGLPPYFDTTVCADEVCRTKPHPEMVLRLAARLSILPAQAMVIGDSVLDIEMGKAAGCATCAVAYGTHSRDRLIQADPDAMIDAIGRLPDLLAGRATRCRAGESARAQASPR